MVACIEMNNTNLVAFNTIVNKEVARFLRIWTQTLLPPVVTQTLYFLIFGGIIGSQINKIPIVDSSGSVLQVQYMQFVVPGLVMMAVLTSAFSNTVSSFFGAKFQRNIEEVLVAPVPNWVIIWGYVVGGALRGILVGIIVFVIAALFGAVTTVSSYPIIAMFVVLTSVAFSLAGLTNAVFAKKFDDVAIVPTFVLTPLTYLGGVFYSLKSLPEFWQNVSKLNPIVYMVDGFRYGFFGVSEVNVWISAGILFTFLIALVLINNYLLNKGVGMRT
jgi:ABC-2 type transport system permease protein